MAFVLEKEALKASGIKGSARIKEYLDKIEQLYQAFILELRSIHEPITKARLLFEWLWIEKPVRYKSQASFRLDQVIDAQLSPDRQTAGNCLGLTLLYNSLLKKMGVEARALYLENAFGTGPHVLTFLETRGAPMDIENILPEGFDYKGHLKNPTRTRWGDRELVADIYHSLGNESFNKGEFAKALRSYDMAIRLNPYYEKAQINKAICLDRIEMEKSVNSGP